MLLEKQFTSGDVVTIKLLGGEEIITRFEEDGADYIKVSRPLSVVPGAQGLGMVPWVFLSSSDTFKINKSVVAAGPVPSKKEAADQYIQGTTGIALS